MSKARELAELSRTVSDSADATAITINSSEEVTFADDIFLADGKKVVLGDSSDLQIYHSSTESWVKETGTGSLYIDTDGTSILLTSANSAKNMISAVKDGAVTLYHNNAAKLATTSTGIDVSGSVTADSLTVDSNVGIGTGANVDEILHVEKSSGTTLVKTEVAAGSTVGFEIKKTGSTTSNWRIVDGQTVNGTLEIYDATNSATRAAIDQSGNFLLGTTNTTWASQEGVRYFNGDSLVITRSGGDGLYVNRLSSDGAIASFYQNGSKVGDVGVANGDLHIDGDTGIRFQSTSLMPRSGGSDADATVDLGLSSHRWKDAYITGLDVTYSTYNKIVSHFSGSYISGFKFSDLNGGIWYDAGTDDLTVSAGHANSQLILESGGSEAARFDNNRNLGIGTETPVNNGTNSHGLTINGTGNYQNIALQKSGATQFLVYLNGTGGTFIDQVTDDPMMFLTNDTERLRINTDGSVQLLHTTAGNITGGNNRAGAVLKLHHEAQWENGYTGGDFLGGIEFSSGDSSAGEGVRAAIKTSVDSYYNTNKLRFYVAQNANTSLLERLELEDNLIFKGRAGTSPRFELVNFDNEDNDTGRETTMRFNGHRSGGEQIVNAQISGHHQGNADDDRGQLKFWTNTGSGGLTEKIQIESGGDVRVKAGSLVVETSGKGIFLGGTAAANELDDFETGTWTPTLIAGTTNPTGGGALAPSGTYTKIGNRVWLTFYVGRSWTNSPSGGVFLGNLPFTVHSTSPNAYFATVTTYKVDFGSANIPFLIPSGGQTNAGLYTAASGGTWSQLTWQSHMTSNAGSYITGTIHYVVA
tara:strand:+ start:691 stop:3129 length:2439 start_codon:yes stop_codon:yes gene_type:complete